MIGFALRAIAAVVTGCGLYLVDFRLSHLNQIEAYGTNGQPMLLFVLLLLTVIGLLVPVFQESWSLSTRGFCVMSATVLALLALGRATGMIQIDPSQPVAYLVQQHLPHWVNEQLAHLRR
ncbi:MAG: hypothetical protein ACREM8_02925 [Vulcanimicrobiaceae bacterium]